MKVYFGKYDFILNYYNLYNHEEPYLYESIEYSIGMSATPIVREEPIMTIQYNQ